MLGWAILGAAVTLYEIGALAFGRWKTLTATVRYLHKRWPKTWWVTAALLVWAFAHLQFGILP